MDWDNNCRVCMSLNDHDQMQYLFASDEDSCETNGLYQLLTSTKASQFDGLPSHLCAQCWDQIIKIRSFRDLCIESDRIYRGNRSVNSDDLISITKDEQNVFSAAEIEEVVEEDDNDEVEGVEDDGRIEVLSNHDDSQYLDTVKEDDSVIGLCVEVEYLEENNGDDDATIPDEDTIENVTSPRRRQRRRNYRSPPPSARTDGGPEQFECDACGQMYPSKMSLLNHLRRHYGIKHNVCTDCDASFTWSRQLYTHRVLCHSDGQPMEYKCGYDNCTKTYIMKHLLREHIRIVHLGRKKNSKLYVCDTCGISKNRTASLRQHMLSHQDPSTWPHACPSCDKRFRSKYTLQYHQDRLHLKIRNVSCPQCESRFYTTAELRQHMISHKAGPTEQCPHCAKLYTSETNLKHHIKRVHEELKQHACEQCDARFTLKWDLTSHVQKVHMGKDKLRKRRKVDTVGHGKKFRSTCDNDIIIEEIDEEEMDHDLSADLEQEME